MTVARCTRSALLSLVVVLPAGTAQAQPPPSTPSSTASLAASAASPTPSEPAVSRWYGWQTLVVDAAPLALFTYGATGRAWREPGVWFWAVAAYSLSGSVVHATHENYGRAWLALAIRTAGAALTLGLLLEGGCIQGYSDGVPNQCDIKAAPLPAFAATAVDAGLLARERVSAPPRSGLWIAPLGKGVAMGGTW
jgi:hypothetical protein